MLYIREDDVRIKGDKKVWPLRYNRFGLCSLSLFLGSIDKTTQIEKVAPFVGTTIPLLRSRSIDLCVFCLRHFLSFFPPSGAFSFTIEGINHVFPALFLYPSWLLKWAVDSLRFFVPQLFWGLLLRGELKLGRERNGWTKRERTKHNTKKERRRNICWLDFRHGQVFIFVELYPARISSLSIFGMLFDSLTILVTKHFKWKNFWGPK